MNRTVSLFASAFAATLLYVQSTVLISHTLHIVVSAALVFLAGVGIVPAHNARFQDGAKDAPAHYDYRDGTAG